MNALLERLSNPAVSIPVLILLTYSLYHRLSAVSRVPEGVPWIGKDSSKLFADTRAFLASFNAVKDWLAVGYDKVPSPPLQLPRLQDCR